MAVSLRTVERAVAHLRRELAAAALATVRLETPPGRQRQIDFGEPWTPIGGERVRVERVMSHNGAGYVSRLFRKACRRILALRHIRTKPYTPRTNGKAERFIQTMLREWAYAIPFRSAGSCAADLPRWLAWYNQQRPHAALDGSPPTSRLPAPA